MKRLLLDQGLPRSAAALLTEAGWDVIHLEEGTMVTVTERSVRIRRLRGKVIVSWIENDGTSGNP